MHTGDNMLAIYASEKALRLAERLGEAAAASRAHGIFGRVFGRIGDSERARENLERSVELARESDPAEAVRALLALGYHLEISEADYDGAAGAYGDALAIALRTGDLPSQVELHAALAQVAAYRGDWEAGERETDASQTLAEREGLDGKLCFPYSMRGVLLAAPGRARRGGRDARARGRDRPTRSGARRSRSSRCTGSRPRCATAATTRTPTQTLARALDLCERAGLVAQSVEATAARAVNLALWGKGGEAAFETAEEAAGLAERLRYPVGVAAGIEARGAATGDPGLLAEARSGLARARPARRRRALQRRARARGWERADDRVSPAGADRVAGRRRSGSWSATRRATRSGPARWSRSPGSPRSPSSATFEQTQRGRRSAPTRPCSRSRSSRTCARSGSAVRPAATTRTGS